MIISLRTVSIVPSSSTTRCFKTGKGGDCRAGAFALHTAEACRSRRREHPSFRQTVSPHSLRHTKECIYCKCVSLEIIRDFLGHVDVKTTEIYARANLEMKRKALEKVADPSSLPTMPSWQKTSPLLKWLTSLRGAAGHGSPSQSRPTALALVVYGEHIFDNVSDIKAF